ncbi:hypothetical protein LTR02_018051 [Friedmanniomyces endolithicus]|nr:hypothetical protein LTR02_018051 [Friedmanniomyces endolithicus]
MELALLSTPLSQSLLAMITSSMSLVIARTASERVKIAERPMVIIAMELAHSSTLLSRRLLRIIIVPSMSIVLGQKTHDRMKIANGFVVIFAPTTPWRKRDQSSFGMGGTIIRRRIAELVVLGRVEAGKQDASEIVCTVNTAFANCAEIATQLFEATIRAAEAGFDITKKDISRVKTAAPLVKKVQNAVGYQRRKVAAIDKITNACPQLLGNGQLPKSADCQRALFTLVDKYSCPDVCALLRLAMFKRFETDAGGVNATLTKDQCPQRNDIFEAVTLAKAAGHESQVLGIQPTDTRARLFTMKHGLPFFASNLIAQLQQVASGRDPNPSLQPTLFPEREAATLPLSSSKSNGFGTAATPPVSLTSTTCTFEALNNGKTMPTISKLKASRKLAVETSGFMLITVTGLPETEWDILQTQMLTCVAAKASKEPSARSGAGSAAVQVGISYRKSGAKDGRAVYRAATGGRDPRAGPSAQPLLAEPSQPASEVHYEEQ